MAKRTTPTSGSEPTTSTRMKRDQPGGSLRGPNEKRIPVSDMVRAPADTDPTSDANGTGDPRLKARERERLTRALVGVRTPAQDIPTISLGEFEGVTAVKAALTGMEQTGVFELAAQLVEAMGRDDRIEGVLSARVGGLLSLPRIIESAKEGDEDGPEVEKLRERFDSMFPPEELTSLVTWGIMLGVGIGQLVWAEVDGQWEPRFRHWHPRYVIWRWDTRSYWVSTVNKGLVEVTPGDGQWVLFTPYGAARGWMKGRLRPLAINWLIRTWGMRDWARHSEALGTPVRRAKVPATASTEDKEAFLADVAALAQESTILLEQDTVEGGVVYDLDLLEAGSAHGANFDALVSKADANIAIAVLGQNLTTEVKGGSYAAAAVHENVRGDVLAYDERMLSACIRDQMVDPWLAVNYGARPTPKVCFDLKPPEDKKAIADTMTSAAGAVVALSGAGIRVDRARLAERFNIPVDPAAAAEDEKQGGAQVFGYHLDAGIITVNEARRMIGLPPLPGAVGSTLVGAVPEPEREREGPPAKGQRLSAAPELDPLTEAQLYADAVADSAKAAGAKAISPELDAVLRAVDGATSYGDMRTRLLSAFKGMDPALFQDVMAKAILLAQLNGRLAARED